MLGEFFAARADEIDDRVVEEAPHGRFPTIEATGLSHVPIARLGEMLGAGAYDDVILDIEVRGSASGQTVLFGIPRPFEMRSQMPTTSVRPPRWASSEELLLSNWRSENVLDLLRS